MKYYMIRIFTQGENETRTIFPFESQKEAEIKFYAALAADMAKADVRKGMCCILNEYGSVVQAKQYEADVTTETTE